MRHAAPGAVAVFLVYILTMVLFLVAVIGVALEFPKPVPVIAGTLAGGTFLMIYYSRIAYRSTDLVPLDFMPEPPEEPASDDGPAGR